MRALAVLIAAAGVVGLTLAFADEPIDGGAASVTVSVTDGGDTTISVTRGQLKLRANGEETVVSAGQGAEVKRGQPARKLSLLAPPEVVAPVDGARVNTLEVTLGFLPLVGARLYHVVVASDARLAHVVFDGATTPGGKLKLPAAGTFYWRIQGIDADGLAGKSSTVRRLVIDVTPPNLRAGKPVWK
jgi:hypothetical protein